MKKLIWAAAVILAVAINLACGKKEPAHSKDGSSHALSQSQENPPARDTLILTIHGSKVTLEVAKDHETLMRGLMFRNSLAPNSGMLFVFERDGMYSFWMKNTRIPLSIAFINSAGRIVGLDEMQPFDTVTVHMPFEPYRYAIEMDSGWFPRKGVKKGDTLTIPGSK